MTKKQPEDDRAKSDDVSMQADAKNRSIHPNSLKDVRSTRDNSETKTSSEANEGSSTGSGSEGLTIERNTDVNSDPNKTVNLVSTSKTVGHDDDFELSGQASPIDATGSQKPTPKPPPKPSDKTVVLNFGNTSEPESGDDFNLTGEIDALTFDQDCDITEDFELGGDLDESLELGEDLVDQPEAKISGNPILPKTMVIEDPTLLSNEFDRSLESSEDLDGSMAGMLGLANQVWGKQSSNATPMTSLEAPIRSKRPVVSPKLNDRLVVADGESEEVGNPDYRIMSFLGAGAMGEVYVARQTSVDRDVAFKKQILKDQKSRRKRIENRNKFLFEAQITASLDHPNIVAVHDMGRDQHGDVFYCMELVRGEPWEEVIDEMTLEDNLEVLLKVIDGVAYAHSKNTIHRDLKPENTMLGSFGEVLIMDWGLGVNLNHGPPQSMGGTPGYMAPEMANPEKEACKHSDIYLLGAILFKITTGQTPHSGDDVWDCLANAQANKIVDASNSPHKIDQRLLAIAHKAMQTEFDDRYASPEQLRLAIENYQSNQLSIKLAERSEVELASAIENKDYEFFSKSMFGFRESVSLWSENTKADTGLQRARIAYAACALDRQDFELGMSLLDPNAPDEAPLYKSLRKGAAASNQRRRLVWLAVGASVLLLSALVFTSMINARTQRLNAENLAVAVKLEKKAKLEAESATVKAEEERGKAEEERRRTEKEKKKAEESKELAEALAIKEESERRRAEELAIKEKTARETAEGLAVKEKAARQKAEELRLKEIEARRTAERLTDEKEAQRMKAVSLADQLQVSEKSARQRLFQSNIGLIDGYIRDNQIEQAINSLTRTRRNDSRFVNWEWNRLYHLCHTEIKSESLEGVTAIDQSDNGTAVILSARGSAKIWKTNSSSAATEFSIANGKALSTSITRDGKWAAIGTADPDRKLTIWEVESGEMVANLSDNIAASLVSCVAFNRSGTKLAAGDSARLITLFEGNGPNWRAAEKLTFHSKRPVDLDFSSDGKRLASASLAGLSIVWDVATGKPLSAYNHPSQFRAVKFHRGKSGLVACATDDREIVFWNSSIPNNPESWQNLPTADLKEAKSRGFVESLITHESVVNDVDFSTDGKTMVTCGDDRTIAVWNLKDRTLTERFRGHVNAVLACCVSQAGNAAVSASADGEIRSWRFDEYEDERSFSSEESSPINCVQFNATATQLLTGDEDGVVRIWNREKSARIESKLEFDPKLGRKAVYLPDSDQIVTSSPGNVFVWQNGKLRHKKTEVGKSGIVVVSKNERQMITGGDEDKPTLVWDLETGRQIATLLKGSSRNRVTAMAISPDDKFLAVGTGSVEGIVSVFDLTTFQLIDEFEGHRGWITDLVFSPSFNEFLSADSVEGYVNAWIIEGNQVRRQKKIDGVGGSYIRIAYSDSGEQFVTSTNTDTNKSEMQVWDSRTKKAVSKVQLARPIDFVSFIKNEIIFRLTNGKAYGWRHAVGARQMRHVPMYSNASYPTALNGWAKLSGNKSLVYGDGFVKVIDSSVARPQTTRQSSAAASVLDSAGNPGPCLAALFADDEKQVVGLYGDGAVRFWDRETNSVTNVIQSSTSSVTGMDVLQAESHLLATCDSRGIIRCIDVQTNKTLCQIDTKSDLQAIKWFGSDAVIVSGSDGLMHVDLNSKKTAMIDSTTKAFSGIDCSKDGEIIVGVGVNRQNQGSVFLWQKVEGAWQKRPNVFGSQVLSTKVSPDGKRVYSGDAAGAITVWYIPEPGSSDPPRKLISLLGHEKDISSIVVSNDGSQVASSSKDGSAILWLSAEPRE